MNTFKWYRDRIYLLDDSYDPTDKTAAFQKALQFGDDGIPLGVIYKEEGRPTYEELHPVIRDNGPLVDREWAPKDAARFIEEFV